MKENDINKTSRAEETKEAILLAGGLGTRLRSIVADLPKCMAPVAGRPFLFYVINQLRLQGIEKFIFSLGYKHEIIENYLKTEFSTLDYQCVVEEEPLGTGGAIQLACRRASAENVLVANGDTLFKINGKEVYAFHTRQQAECTLALKLMQHFDRYGIVELKEEQQVGHFREKQYYEKGLINGGVYLLNRQLFLAKNFPPAFSFEKDYLEQYFQRSRIAGLVQDAYFIDIGIPEDYNRAQEELKQPALDLSQVDKSWTLFLDRDGVINHDKPGSYVFNAGEFEMYDGVPQALKYFTEKFGRVIVATNQRGVGKNLMSLADLDDIHHKMISLVEAEGGKIDAIFYAADLSDTSPLRKPNPGMAVRAKEMFPDIDLSRSIMVGNNLTDMEFGRHAGMYTIFLTTTNAAQPFPHPAIDKVFTLLTEFAKAL